MATSTRLPRTKKKSRVGRRYVINASEAEDPQRYMVLKLGLIITVLIDKRVMDMCNSLREKSREAICFALITNYRSHDTQFLMLSL